MLRPDITADMVPSETCHTGEVDVILSEEEEGEMTNRRVKTVCQEIRRPQCHQDWTLIGDSCYQTSITQKFYEKQEGSSLYFFYNFNIYIFIGLQLFREEV